MRKTVLILGHSDATQFIDIFNQYTRLFDKEKYEVTVAYLTGSANPATAERTIAENVLFLDIPKKNLRTLKISAIRKLLGLCRQKQFEIVICHRYKPAYIMLWVAQFYKIPAMVFVMHELHTMSAFGRRLLLTALARDNMLFGGVSNAVRDDMRKDLRRIPQDRIVTLYNVIDVELTEPQFYTRDEARKKLNLHADDIVFGNVARLAPNKDQHSLIQAFSLIKPYCPHAKLILMGNGMLENQLKQQAQAYGLSEDIIFTGYLPQAYRYMKAFDAFVLSSVQEAFGRVLIEAMLARVPVIATQTNGIPEVVSDAGTLVKPRDPAALSAAMKHFYLTTNAERSAISEKAYKHVVAQFSIQAFQDQFWQLPLLAAIKE